MQRLLAEAGRQSYIWTKGTRNTIQDEQDSRSVQAEMRGNAREVYRKDGASAYCISKNGQKCQMMEQEIENLSKDKQELQEKFSEKSRQKQKLDEMYDQLRSEYESIKRSAIQPANKFFSRTDPGLFDSPANMMDNRDATC